MRKITTTEFKAKCLSLIDEVAASGETIVIIKRGKAVARLSPESRAAVEPRNAAKSILGSMRGLIEIVDPDDDLTSAD